MLAWKQETAEKFISWLSTCSVGFSAGNPDQFFLSCVLKVSAVECLSINPPSTLDQRFGGHLINT